jgi:hypothetical protein
VPDIPLIDISMMHP